MILNRVVIKSYMQLLIPTSRSITLLHIYVDYIMRVLRFQPARPLAPRPLSKVLNLMKRGVSVCGACNTDLIAYVPRMPRAGETIMGNSFRTG
jgi:hypothetical protein